MATGILGGLPFCQVVQFSCQVEQVSELAALAEAVLDYHKHCQEVMERLVATLNNK